MDGCGLMESNFLSDIKGIRYEEFIVFIVRVMFIMN